MRSIFVVISLLVALNSYAQSEVDVVYLKNGSKIRGKIIEQYPMKSLTIRTADGSEWVFKMTEIEKIVKEVIELQKSNLKDSPNLRESAYTEVGGSLGTPAGINLMAGHWFGIMGLRVSGLVLGADRGGIQLNYGIKLSDTRKRSHVIAATIGSMSVGNAYWNYLGAVYNLNVQGFFLETGLTFGSGSYSSPQLGLQIGYLHRFIQNVNK